MEYTLKVPWGAWELESGWWHPNSNIDLSVEEQHLSNVKNGYSCDHYRAIVSCPICNEK